MQKMVHVPFEKFPLYSMLEMHVLNYVACYGLVPVLDWSHVMPTGLMWCQSRPAWPHVVPGLM